MYCIWACLCMYLCASECNVYVCECVFVRVWWRGLFEMLREWLWKTEAFLLWATLVNPALQLNGLGWTCTRNNLFRLWMATIETPPSLTCTLWDPTRKCLRTCFTDKMLSVLCVFVIFFCPFHLSPWCAGRCVLLMWISFSCVWIEGSLKAVSH